MDAGVALSDVFPEAAGLYDQPFYLAAKHQNVKYVQVQAVDFFFVAGDERLRDDAGGNCLVEQVFELKLLFWGEDLAGVQCAVLIACKGGCGGGLNLFHKVPWLVELSEGTVYTLAQYAVAQPNCTVSNKQC